MAKSTVAVRFTGDVANLKSAIGDVDGKMGGLGQRLGSVGGVAAAGFAVAGAAIVGFAAKSANTFAQVGGEVLKLKRYTGATAEDASRLRFAGQQAGLGVDDLTKSLGLLSKNIVSGKAEKLGFDLKDAAGKALPLNDSLLKIAERFKEMPNGVEKNALALNTFGKAGASMIPFLNRGADGIKELEKQSDKLGTTLSGKDLDAVKQSTANHRLFTAAMQGLQIQIGRYVLPIMTAFTGFIATHMTPVIGVLRTVMEGLSPVFELIGSGFEAIGKVFGRINILWQQFTAGFLYGAADFADGSNDMGQKILRFGETIKNVVEQVRTYWNMFQTAFSHGATDFQGSSDRIQVVVLTLGNALRQVFAFVKEHITPILIGLGVAVLALISPMALVIGALLAAYIHFEGFRNVVNAVVEFLATKVLPIIVQFAASIISSFSDLVVAVQQRWGAISEAIGHVVNAIRDIITPIINVIAVLWRAWGDDLLHVVQTVFGLIAATIQNLVQVIKGVIDVFLAVINGDWGQAWNGIKEIFSGVWNQIHAELSAVLSIIQSLIGGVLSTIAQVWNGIWDKMRGAVSAVWGLIVLDIKAHIAIITGAINGIKSFITSVGSTLWGGLGTGLGGVISGIRAALSAMISFVIRIVNDAIQVWNDIPFHKDIKKIGDPSAGLIASGPHAGEDPHHLASGGIVRSRLGGILARIGEGGDNEAVIPLSERGMQPLIDGIVSRLGGSAQMPNIELHVHAEGAIITEGIHALVSLLTPALRDELEQLFRRNGALTAVGF